MNKNKFAQIFHLDLYGKREKKYDFLNENSIDSVEWTELQPREPNYFFVQKDYAAFEDYQKGFKVNELFPVNSVGIVTARDKFTIHDTKEETKKTIEEFLSLGDETARAKFKLGKDVRDWKVGYARKDLENNYLTKKGKFAKVSYRPFDDKWTFFTGNSKGFHCYPRTEVMQHFLKGENVGLVYKLGNTEEKSASVMISKSIIDFRSWSRPGMQGGDYISPLYLYPTEKNKDLFPNKEERIPNLKIEIVNQIAKNLGLQFVPEKDGKIAQQITKHGQISKHVAEYGKVATFPDDADGDEKSCLNIAPIDILDYIYAVLHSPKYREKYKEFLKIDFPRIPYPTDKNKFWQLVKLGGEIRKIHLLESPKVEEYITQYPIDGNNEITRKITKNSPGFEPTKDGLGKVWINDTQYFDNVPEIAWNFYIGGYQPAQKWLKDRKERTLEFDDILHYQKIIVALTETDRLMKEIDEIEFMD